MSLKQERRQLTATTLPCTARPTPHQRRAMTVQGWGHRAKLLVRRSTRKRFIGLASSRARQVLPTTQRWQRPRRQAARVADRRGWRQLGPLGWRAAACAPSLGALQSSATSVASQLDRGTRRLRIDFARLIPHRVFGDRQIYDASPFRLRSVGRRANRFPCANRLDAAWRATLSRLPLAQRFAAIAQGLGDVKAADAFLPVEIGQRAGNAQGAVEAARRQRQRLGRLPQ